MIFFFYYRQNFHPVLKCWDETRCGHMVNLGHMWHVRMMLHTGHWSIGHKPNPFVIYLIEVDDNSVKKRSRWQWHFLRLDLYASSIQVHIIIQCDNRHNNNNKTQLSIKIVTLHIFQYSMHSFRHNNLSKHQRHKQLHPQISHHKSSSQKQCKNFTIGHVNRLHVLL